MFFLLLHSFTPFFYCIQNEHDGKGALLMPHLKTSTIAKVTVKAQNQPEKNE